VATALLLTAAFTNVHGTTVILGTSTWTAGGSTGTGTATVNDNVTWDWDAGLEILTGTGTYEMSYTTVAGPSLFTHKIVNPILDVGTGASAGSYECIEGLFGGVVGAHICGNYTFGLNGTNDSTITYGPSTSYNLTLNPDDIAAGLPQTIAAYDPLSYSWNAGTGVLEITGQTGFVLGELQSGASEVGDGYLFTFNVPTAVPIPAAAWLFGSALGIMGFLRRRTA